jgi:hypothetical protein
MKKTELGYLVKVPLPLFIGVALGVCAEDAQFFSTPFSLFYILYFIFYILLFLVKSGIIPRF